MKIKKLFVIVIVAAGSSVAIARLFAGSHPVSESSLVPVRNASFEVKVSTVGHLDTASAFHVVSAVRGDRGKIIKIAEDGARVEKGDVLVAFDPTFFEAEIQRLTGEVRSHESIIEYQAQMLKLARSEADKAISNQKLELATARQEHARYQAYISELKALKDQKGYAFESEIAQARRKADEAYTKLKKSEADLERVRRESVFKIAQAVASLSKARSETDTVREALVQARGEYEKTSIRAPTAGFVVLEETAAPGDQKHKLRVGDTVWQGQPILYLPDSSSMLVKTQVREIDLHKLQPGLEAAVQVDAYPETRLAGRVDAIGVLALENSNAPEKNFQFTIRLRDGDARLRPGMTARVSIVVDRVQDVPTVPLGALFYENGSHHSYVLDHSRLVERKVGIGLSNEDVAQVISGLSAGEKVSLVKP